MAGKERKRGDEVSDWIVWSIQCLVIGAGYVVVFGSAIWGVLYVGLEITGKVLRYFGHYHTLLMFAKESADKKSALRERSRKIWSDAP